MIVTFCYSSYMPALDYFSNVIDCYQRFIERYDERQIIVDKAVADYNMIDFVFRTEDIVKSEVVDIFEYYFFPN